MFAFWGGIGAHGSPNCGVCSIPHTLSGETGSHTKEFSRVNNRETIKRRNHGLSQNVPFATAATNATFEKWEPKAEQRNLQTPRCNSKNGWVGNKIKHWCEIIPPSTQMRRTQTAPHCFATFSRDVLTIFRPTTTHPTRGLPALHYDNWWGATFVSRNLQWIPKWSLTNQKKCASSIRRAWFSISSDCSEHFGRFLKVLVPLKSSNICSRSALVLVAKLESLSQTVRNHISHIVWNLNHNRTLNTSGLSPALAVCLFSLLVHSVKLNRTNMWLSWKSRTRTPTNIREKTWNRSAISADIWDVKENVSKILERSVSNQMFVCAHFSPTINY